MLRRRARAQHRRHRRIVFGLALGRDEIEREALRPGSGIDVELDAIGFAQAETPRHRPARSSVVIILADGGERDAPVAPGEIGLAESRRRPAPSARAAAAIALWASRSARRDPGRSPPWAARVRRGPGAASFAASWMDRGQSAVGRAQRRGQFLIRPVLDIDQAEIVILAVRPPAHRIVVILEPVQPEHLGNGGEIPGRRRGARCARSACVSTVMRWPLLRLPVRFSMRGVKPFRDQHRLGRRSRRASRRRNRARSSPRGCRHCSWWRSRRHRAPRRASPPGRNRSAAGRRKRARRDRPGGCAARRKRVIMLGDDIASTRAMKLAPWPPGLSLRRRLAREQRRPGIDARPAARNRRRIAANHRGSSVAAVLTRRCLV